MMRSTHADDSNAGRKRVSEAAFIRDQFSRYCDIVNAYVAVDSSGEINAEPARWRWHGLPLSVQPPR